MDRLRQQFFAGAGFAEQENRSVGAGHTLRLGEHFLERPALADNSPVVMLQRDLLSKIDVLPFETFSKLLVLGKRGPDCLVGPLAHQGIGEDLPDHLQARDDFRVPVTLLPYERKTDRAQNRAAYAERNGHGGLDTLRQADLPLFRSLRRQSHPVGTSRRAFFLCESPLCTKEGVRRQQSPTGNGSTPGTAQEWVTSACPVSSLNCARLLRSWPNVSRSLFRAVVDHAVDLIGRLVDERRR